MSKLLVQPSLFSLSKPNFCAPARTWTFVSSGPLHNPADHCIQRPQICWRFILPRSNPVMFLCISVLHLNSLLVTAAVDQVVGGLLVWGIWGVGGWQRSCHLVWGTHTPDPALPGLCNSPSLPPPSKQSISVVLQGKHIYWLVTACQCGSSGPVAEGISLGRGQGENGGN